jgi:hypothetical protein
MTVTYTADHDLGYAEGRFKVGNAKVAIRDLPADTGTYVTGGNSITAASLGLRTIDFVDFGTQGMTGGASGATINWLGVTYASNRQSVTFQQYESRRPAFRGWRRRRLRRRRERNGARRVLELRLMATLTFTFTAGSEAGASIRALAATIEKAATSIPDRNSTGASVT